MSHIRIVESLAAFKRERAEKRANGWTVAAHFCGKGTLRKGAGQGCGKRKCPCCSFWENNFVGLGEGHAKTCFFCTKCWKLDEFSLDGLVPRLARCQHNPDGRYEL